MNLEPRFPSLSLHRSRFRRSPPRPPASIADLAHHRAAPCCPATPHNWHRRQSLPSQPQSRPGTGYNRAGVDTSVDMRNLGIFVKVVRRHRGRIVPLAALRTASVDSGATGHLTDSWRRSAAGTRRDPPAKDLADCDDKLGPEPQRRENVDTLENIDTRKSNAAKAVSTCRHFQRHYPGKETNRCQISPGLSCS